MQLSSYSYISLHSPKQEEFTCKLILNNFSVPDNNRCVKCSGICRSFPWNNDNPILHQLDAILHRVGAILHRLGVILHRLGAILHRQTVDAARLFLLLMACHNPDVIYIINVVSTRCYIAPTGCNITSSRCYITSSRCYITPSRCNITSTRCYIAPTRCNIASLLLHRFCTILHRLEAILHRVGAILHRVDVILHRLGAILHRQTVDAVGLFLLLMACHTFTVTR